MAQQHVFWRQPTALLFTFDSTNFKLKKSRFDNCLSPSSGTSSGCTRSFRRTVSGFYSVLFTAPKPNTGYRNIHPILDFKSLNRFLCVQKLLMQPTRFVIALLRKGKFSAPVEAYFYILHSPDTPMLPTFCCGRPALTVCGTAIWTLFCTLSVHSVLASLLAFL